MGLSKFQRTVTPYEMEQVMYGSTHYIQTEKIDKRAINTAITRCIMPYAWKLEEYSSTQAAQDVVDDLLKVGFCKISRNKSIISQGNVKFRVGRPENNPDMFVTLEPRDYSKKQVKRGHN